MTKYNSPDPADQPIHDMMDDIEIAYKRAENFNVHPLKIKAVLQYMVKIFTDEHPEIIGMDDLINGFIEAISEAMQEPPT